MKLKLFISSRNPVKSPSNELLFAIYEAAKPTFEADLFPLFNKYNIYDPSMGKLII